MSEREVFEYYIKTGDFKISDKSLEVALKYLKKQYSIKRIDFSAHYDDVITFVDCYNKDLDEYYYILPKFTYKGLRFTKKELQVDVIVDNACILATINRDNVFDVKRMRFYILKIAKKYAHKTKNGLIISEYTVNELLQLCCDNLQEKIDKDILDKSIYEQLKKNSKSKTVTVGNISSSEKKSLSHLKFNYEEDNYVKFLYSEGYSYRKIMQEFTERYDKKISLKSVQNILKRTVY